MDTALTSPHTSAATAGSHHNLRIDPQRLWDSLMELAAVGATDKGGVCRLALTELDRQGRALFMRWAREAGCTLRVDAIGNLFARRAGSDPALPAVATGSHIDTQPTGGKFDGNYGVLAGLEVLRTLERRRRPHRGAARGLRLDQRGRLALRAGDDGLGRLRRRLHPRSTRWRRPTATASASPRRCRRSATPARRRPRSPTARRASAPTSRRTSSRDRCSRTPTSRSASVTGALGQRWYDVIVDRPGGARRPDADGAAPRRAAGRHAA